MLGDISAERDWGHAKDYVYGMWLSLNAKEPSDYIFCTGVLHSIEEVLDIAFSTLDLEWKKYVQTDESMFRPIEPVHLVGNFSKAKKELGWQPTISFDALIKEMVLSDFNLLKVNN